VVPRVRDETTDRDAHVALGQAVDRVLERRIRVLVVGRGLVGVDGVRVDESLSDWSNVTVVYAMRPFFESCGREVVLDREHGLRFGRRQAPAKFSTACCRLSVSGVGRGRDAGRLRERAGRGGDRGALSASVSD
jgi:hypothetical protein